MIAGIVFVTIATTLIGVSSWLLGKIKQLIVGFPIVFAIGLVMIAATPFTPTEIVELEFEKFPCHEEDCALNLEYTRIELHDQNQQLVGLYQGPVTGTVMVPMKRIPEQMTITTLFTEDYLDVMGWPVIIEDGKAKVQMQWGTDSATFYLTALGRSYTNPVVITGDLVEMATNMDIMKNIWSFGVAVFYFFMLAFIYIIVGTIAIILYHFAKGTCRVAGKVKGKVSGVKLSLPKKKKKEKTDEEYWR